MNEPPTPICIIGMHRSGTSMIVRLLNLCGLDLGPAEELIGPNESNPLGHFEHLGFFRVNEALLEHFDGSWDDPPALKADWEYDPSLDPIVEQARAVLRSFSKGSHWGWKDPRTTILLPFWKSLVPNLRFVLCMRSPLEVAKSLARRDRMPLRRGISLWNQYTRAAICDTEGEPRMFIFYEDFFKNPAGEIDRLVEFCGLQRPDDLSGLYEAISDELRHHTSETFDLLNDTSVITEYKLLYIGLRALCTESFIESPSHRRREDLISDNITEFFKLLEKFHHEQEILQLQSLLAEKEQQLTRFQFIMPVRQRTLARRDKEIRDFREVVAHREARINELQAAVQTQHQALSQREAQINELQATLQAQHQALLQRAEQREEQVRLLTTEKEWFTQESARLQVELNLVYSTLGWKIVTLYWRFRDVFLPPKTRRRIIYDWIVVKFKRDMKIQEKVAKVLSNDERITDTLLEKFRRMRRKGNGRFASSIWKVLTRSNVTTFKRYFRPYNHNSRNTRAKRTISEINGDLSNDQGETDRMVHEPVYRGIVDQWKDTTVSVVIPVKNAGEDFYHLLAMLKSQKGFKAVEIIAVDSGSTDATLEIAEEFGAKIVQIQPEEFSHSYARNLGAKYASGEYLLFTVQDALPPSDVWLQELLRVIKEKGVAAVSCAEFPREDADLFYRALSWNHYRFLEVEGQDRILAKPAHENFLTLRKNGQLSDIACLISREVFVKYWLRGNYAEDLDLGIRLIKDGYRLALLGSTRIIHSHNRPAYYHLKRGYVDNLSLPQILPGYPISAIEPDRLFRDILFMYEAVNALVHRELHRLIVPCSIEELTKLTMQTFHASMQEYYPSSIDIVQNPYVDSQFNSFLGKIHNHHYRNSTDAMPYDGILNDAMQNLMTTILKYMDYPYDLIDDLVLKEFKLCLYKAYAYLCGVHLAFSLPQVSKTNSDEIRKIQDELCNGI